MGWIELTWEWEENIPKFIRDLYHESGQKEFTIPLPRIRHSKRVGKDTYCLLRWENYEAEDRYVKLEDLIFPMQIQRCRSQVVTQRNTWEKVEKLVEEIYGSESLHIFHNVICKWIKTSKRN